MGCKMCANPVPWFHRAEFCLVSGDKVADRSAVRRFVERGQVEAVDDLAIGTRLGNETHPL